MSRIDGVIFETGRCDDSTASIQLKCAGDDLEHLGSAALWEGAVRGPLCQYSRTLAADYSITSQGSVMITEPCYWKPSMPFLYEVVAKVAARSGVIRSVQRGIGLRRLEPRGGSLFLDGRRMVLRGATVSTPSDALALDDTDKLFTQAREEEAALLIQGYDDAFCFSAAEKGVPLIVDLRDDPPAATMRLPTPAEQPAVLAWLVDATQTASLDRIPGGALLAAMVAGETRQDSVAEASLLAVECKAASPPPAWLASAAKPVIAIRPRSGAPRLNGARQRASALQAELAPTFDLAGYFA